MGRFARSGWRARWAAPKAFPRLALMSLAGLWLIVPSGGLVRLTASGLGCEEWGVTCNDGKVLPALAHHELIEFTNRLFSLIVMGVAILTWFVARAGAAREISRWAAGAALCTVGQVPLGGITVLSDLHPVAVASHFLLSMVAIALGVVCVLRARDRASGTRRALDRRRAPVAGLAALALVVGLTTGTLVTAAGPHPGDRSGITRLWNLEDAAYVHVRAVFVFAAIAVVVAVLALRTAESLTRRVAIAWIPLIGAQIAVGEWQWRHQLPWEVILVHVTLAGLLWACTVAVTDLLARPARAESAPPVGERLAGDAPLRVGADA